MKYHDTLTTVGMIKRQIRINVDKDVEKSVSSYISGGICEMGTAAMENSWAVPLNVKYGVTILSSNSTPRHISKKMKNICLRLKLRQACS